MWQTDPPPKTPLQYRTLLSESYFSFSPVSNELSTSEQLLTENFRTPLSINKERNFVIIPLQHSSPKLLQGISSVQGHPDGSLLFSNTTPLINPSNQPRRRSPEKLSIGSPGPICRICHEGDKEEILLSPCNCSGSMLLVHKTCLEKWLSTSNSDHCELCMKQLPVRKECRPIWQWFSMTSSTDGPQGFYADLTCVMLLTPLCLLSIYLCAIGAIDYMKHGVWEGTGLAALSLFLLGTYLTWCYITVRFHWQTLKKWRLSNQVIQLVERECRIRLPSQVSDFAAPRNTIVVNRGLDSSPEVHVFSPVGGEYPSVQHVSAGRNHANVLVESLQELNMAHFL